MRKIVIAFVLASSFFMCYAQPTVELGIRASRFTMEDVTFFTNTVFSTDVFYEMYWGISGELLICFANNFGLRLETFEFRKLDRGGTCFDILSNLDFDFIFILPIGHKFSPLVYLGGYFKYFWNTPAGDMRGYDPAYELRAGLGAQYRLQDKTKLFLEIEMYTNFQSQSKRWPIEDMIYYYNTTNLGFNRINLGLRYTI